MVHDNKTSPALSLRNFCTSVVLPVPTEPISITFLLVCMAETQDTHIRQDDGGMRRVYYLLHFEYVALNGGRVTIVRCPGNASMHLFMPTRRSVRKVSRERSMVGTTIDANDCPIDGVKAGTWLANGGQSIRGSGPHRMGIKRVPEGDTLRSVLVGTLSSTKYPFVVWIVGSSVLRNSCRNSALPCLDSYAKGLLGVPEFIAVENVAQLRFALDPSNAKGSSINVIILALSDQRATSPFSRLMK